MKRNRNKFRWDLFLVDYRAFMNKETRTLKEIAYALDVAGPTLSGLRTGRLSYVGSAVLNKVLAGMKMNYDFYCDFDYDE